MRANIGGGVIVEQIIQPSAIHPIMKMSDVGPEAQSRCSFGHSLSHVETILVKYLSLTRDLARSAMTKLENAGSDFSGLV